MSSPPPPDHPTIDCLEHGGRVRRLALDDLLAQLALARRSASPSWAQDRLDLVARVSDGILRRGGVKAGPGVIHFAFWTRRTALKRLAADAEARRPAKVQSRPRGLVFHLPPQNVETVFLYSWVISYLVGNANITRLPTRLSEEMSALLGEFQAALSDARCASQIFVRYGVDDDINRGISAVSDARVVWGGDAKIQSFAPFALRNGGKALWFGDRRSLAIIDGEALAALGREDRAGLAERLHNDVFVFDQMACSSPQRLYMVGDRATHGAAVAAFLADLSDVAQARGSVAATGQVIRKMVVGMAMTATGDASRLTRHSNALTTVEAATLSERPVVGGGFLEVLWVENLQDVCGLVGEAVQTAVHFGVSAQDLAAFATALPPLAVSRLAPIGQALDFDVIWDGYDLAGELSQLRVIG